VIYDDERGHTMSGADDGIRTLGPFETSSDAMLALRPGDGSFTGPEALFDLLKSTLHGTGVRLGGWDWCVVRWLAGQDVQTAAAIAGWITRSLGELADTSDDGREPYCSECGAWIGMFFGLAGWQHFRGDPAPGGKRQLFGTEHAAVPAWCQPPGRALSPADAVIVRQALADAELGRRAQAAAWCADCEAHPAGACESHVDDLDQADAYRELAAALERDADGGQS
jgi:hypothetical protein